MTQAQRYQPSTRPSGAWAAWLVIIALTARWAEAQAAM